MSLTLAIAAYQAGLADYNAHAPSDNDAADAYARVSYAPPMDALRQWTAPAASHAEALLALDTALEELDIGDVDTAEVLVRAAALYLRGAGGS